MLLTYLWYTALSAVALTVLVLYFCLPSGKRPPRYSYLTNALTGKFNMKETGPIGMVTAGYKALGDAFHIRTGYRAVNFLIGPNAGKLFFDAKDSELGQAAVYGFTVPVFGDGIVYDAPKNEFNQQLKFLRTGLTGDAMRVHCNNIIREASEYFERWGAEGTVDLHDELSNLTIMTASRTLLGREIRERMHDVVAPLYQDLSDGLSHVSWFAPYLPTPRHRRRDAARKKIVPLFKQAMAERRQAIADGEPEPQDFLMTLINARYKDGRALGDDAIIGLLLAALFGGQHSSAISSTWMGLLITRAGDDMVQRLRQEQKEVLERFGGELTLESLSEMKLLDACFKETLRMYPPLIMLMRKVLKDIKYKDYVIPAGDIVVTSPTVSMLLPEVFTNPTEFDPDRWLRGEGDGKYDFIPFGGGRHKCLGSRFGYVQVKTIWSLLLRKYDFELPKDQAFPKIDYSGIVSGPVHPCNIHYKLTNDVDPSIRVECKQ